MSDTTQRLLVFAPDGRDISDEIELRDGKSNGFGWSQYRIVHVYKINDLPLEDEIGWLESGSPMLNDGYTHRIEDIE